MGVFCCHSNTFATLSRAAAKSTRSRLRRLGLLLQTPNWTRRAAVCERCMLRVIHRGQSYCGRPLLHQIQRDPTTDGCGCPCHEKAKDPSEHCPIDRRHRPPILSANRCTCKWCEIENSNADARTRRFVL